MAYRASRSSSAPEICNGRERVMRYVGRYRGPRPLLLRRPVVGGVAAAALLAAPVLYVTGSFGGAIQGGTPTKQIADGTLVSPTAEDDGDVDPEATVVPT